MDQRRLAAIVAADVVGFSRLMGNDESATLAMLKAHLRELIEPLIAQNRGRIVKTTGDGLLADFASVVDAVRCAMQVQRGMAERNASVQPERKIEFRVGINVGDIIIDGDDIYGDGVNVAARLEALAPAGGVCVSRAVRDQVVDKLDFAFDEMGPRQVKNIARPVEVFRVVEPAAGTKRKPPPNVGIRRRIPRLAALAALPLVLGAALLVYWRPYLQEPGAPLLSVAVMPFKAATADSRHERLAERVTLDLTAGLERAMRNALVLSQGLVSKHTGQTRDPRAIGRQLNVRYLVEGELRGEQDSVSILARVVETGTGTQIWSQQLDAAGDNAMTPTIGKLSNALRPVIYRAERKRVAQGNSASDGAMELVLRGDEATISDPSPKGLEKARELYELALRKDPDSVSALLAMYWLKWTEFFQPKADRDRLIREIDDLTTRAALADRRDARAWRARAQALSLQWRWEGAFEANAEALRLDTFQSAALMERAFLFILTGQAEKAIPLIDQAIALDQQSAAMPNLLHIKCWSYLHLRRFEEAVSTCEKGAALGENYMLHVRAAAAYALMGDLPKAQGAKARALKRQPKLSIALLTGWKASDNPVFLKEREETLFAGLRKIGVPEK